MAKVQVANEHTRR